MLQIKLTSLTLLILTANISLAQTQAVPDRFQQYSERKYTPIEIETMRPPSANPWRSTLPAGTQVDWNYWYMKRKMESQKSLSRRSSQVQTRMMLPRHRRSPIIFLNNFGTKRKQNSSLEISGEFNLPEPEIFTPSPEDEGSILLASETGLVPGSAIKVSAEIGDGPFGASGTGSGDIDFYAVRNVVAGQQILVDIDTPIPFEALDSFVEIYNANGDILANNDNGEFDSLDSLIVFTAPEDGDYFISVAGFGTFALNDPFDSASGLGILVGSSLNEGSYTAIIGLDYFDEDEFLFNMRRGDVLGAGITETLALLSVSDRTGTERQGSLSDNRFFMPDESPLPGGLASISHVVDKPGLHRLKVRGIRSGAYSLQLEAALPKLREAPPSDFQTIFIDFDGATLNAPLLEIFRGTIEEPSATAELSPLSAFLPNWNLSAADEDSVINKIMRVVKRSLVNNIRRNHRNRRFKIRLLNSRDHRDPFGRENVSRIIVGGTIEQFGITTIGQAESIDVGNFNTKETAVVLLDILSSTDPAEVDSLNNIPRRKGASIIDVIGLGVGKIVAHEAGHFLGNFHTDPINNSPNIMDAGGFIPLGELLAGIGSDGVFGTRDDIDVRFGRDTYEPTEGFTGIENTRTTILLGNTRRKQPRIKFPYYRINYDHNNHSHHNHK